MNILLITDVPPCKEFSGSLLTDQLCRFLPEGSVSCFVVSHSSLNNIKASPDLTFNDIEYTLKLRETVPGQIPCKFKPLFSCGLELYNSNYAINNIIDRAVRFGERVKPDLVWCILQGQTMIRLALPIALALGVPLNTQIWDTPEWWLSANQVDKYSSKIILSCYDKTISASDCCGTASFAMSDTYKLKYGVNTVPLIASLDQKFAEEPAISLNASDQIVIGMAGQIYSLQEWNLFLDALDSVDWTIAGRKVILRFFGYQFSISGHKKVNIQYYGYMPQHELIPLLSKCDILYCPYMFSSEHEITARTSFPSKLTSYLAAGRPVLFHGPEYSSPAIFLNKYNAGHLCTSLDKNMIINSVIKLIEDEEYYAKLAQYGHRVFLEHLTIEALKINFLHFIKTNNIA